MPDGVTCSALKSARWVQEWVRKTNTANADMLVFNSEKLLSLYAGIIYSMPIYRLSSAEPPTEIPTLT